VISSSARYKRACCGCSGIHASYFACHSRRWVSRRLSLAASSPRVPGPLAQCGNSNPIATMRSSPDSWGEGNASSCCGSIHEVRPHRSETCEGLSEMAFEPRPVRRNVRVIGSQALLQPIDQPHPAPRRPAVNGQFRHVSQAAMTAPAIAVPSQPGTEFTSVMCALTLHHLYQSDADHPSMRSPRDSDPRTCVAFSPTPRVHHHKIRELPARMLIQHRSCAADASG